MIDANKLVPKKDLVIVKLLNLDEIYDGLITQASSNGEDIAIRYAEVISIGSDVDTNISCKGLLVRDTVIITEFAGHYIATEDVSNIYKVVRGYDIIGKYMDTKNVNDIDKLAPTSDRLLLEIFTPGDTEDGVITSGSDPKLADLIYGKVMSVGNISKKLDINIDDIAVCASYVGTTVRHYESDDKKELRVIVESDILFTA